MFFRGKWFFPYNFFSPLKYECSLFLQNCSELFHSASFPLLGFNVIFFCDAAVYLFVIYSLFNVLFLSDSCHFPFFITGHVVIEKTESIKVHALFLTW